MTLLTLALICVAVWLAVAALAVAIARTPAGDDDRLWRVPRSRAHRAASPASRTSSAPERRSA